MNYFLNLETRNTNSPALRPNLQASDQVSAEELKIFISVCFLVFELKINNFPKLSFGTHFKIFFTALTPKVHPLLFVLMKFITNYTVRPLF
jgi:hypothetical protein